MPSSARRIETETTSDQAAARRIRLAIREYGQELRARHPILARAYFPLGWVHFGLWYGFLAGTAVSFVAEAAGFTPKWPTALQTVASVWTFLVVCIAPNVLRSFCLNFVSSNIHYFGDVEEGNVMQQTQVANGWWLLPSTPSASPSGPPTRSITSGCCNRFAVAA